MEEAGMGVAAGDYDNDGWLDILKTNFSDEVPNLYRNAGKAIYTDMDEAAGLNRQTHFVGWGCGFFDPDNDGLLDILYCNGHVYPELDAIHTASRVYSTAILATANLKMFHHLPATLCERRRPAVDAHSETSTMTAASMF
jgi:hypothetical protein